MSIFRLPDLGEGLQEAEIVAWHVSSGDHVVADQPLVSVETDKAVVEIPAPRSGRIGVLHGAVGDVIRVGAELAEFEDAEGADTGAVVGELPQAEESSAAPAPALTAPATAPHVKALPAVRALAQSLGVDLSGLSGSGPEGVITSADVRRAADGGAGAEEPLHGPRRAMAQAMARSGREVVAATIQDDADIGHWPEDAEPNIRLIRAIAAGIAAEPRLNAWFDGERLVLEVRETLDLGIAVDTPDGLFVPVIRDAAGLDDETLKNRLEALEAAVAERTATREDLTGQTFTLSNFGMIAGRHVTLVVVPPQVAILGAGRIEDRVVAADGKPAVSRVLPLSLSFDHRAITGGEAARFMAAVKKELMG